MRTAGKMFIIRPSSGNTHSRDTGPVSLWSPISAESGASSGDLASVTVQLAGQSSASPSPSQVVSGNLRGALASDQHNVSSHPHTGPRDITTLPLQAAKVLDDVLDDVSPNIVHRVRRYVR